MEKVINRFYINFILLFELARTHQYVKNIFIFAPLFFALKLNDFIAVEKSFIAFIAFSLTASAIYILNDFCDIEEDKLHPTKRERPLASGQIDKYQALFIMAIFFVLGITIMGFISNKALLILSFYIVLNITYIFILKNIAILDVITIAIGFVLRLFVGASVTDITLSSWIVIMVFLLALFMALAKRRDDVLIFLETGKNMRKVIKGYNLQFLDSAMMIMAAVVIVAYVIYITSLGSLINQDNSSYLYLTVLFVILGIMKYLQITFVLKDTGSPTKIILKNRFIQLTLIGWITTFFFILY